ncbi:MAG: C-terminal helicase domain-containing protein, partial [Eubacteriales bacterium]
AKKVTPDRDTKLKTLKEQVFNKIENCSVNPGNKKVVIFTAFADTASYIYTHLAGQLTSKGIYSAIVTGSGENNSTLPLTPEMRRTIQLKDLSSVLTLFSPISKDCDKVFPETKARIDVLIGTDCISEGQNLQDCDYLINYDIHWNPVRIIQRFGRIDRIGSVNEKIQLVNFWPTQDLDEYINLKQRVQGRMVLLDVSATGEENLIDSSDNREMKDLEYRKKQLQRLQTEVVDLEDISGGISITDLTFTDFKLDLMGYMKESRKLLDEAPAGMYAVAEISESLRDSVKPGIIFTLRQINGKLQTKEQNPLKSYYMLYVTDEGDVNLSFMQVKKILDYYKKICSGQRTVLAELVAEFNKQTDDGRDMRHYSDLLSKTVENLVGKKQEIGVASLFSKGGTTLQASYYDGVEDFELITFLILK